MKISWRWLGRHFNTEGLSPSDIMERFIMCVAEIEGINKTGENLKGIKVCRINSIKNHPSSDKLKIAEVEIAEGVNKITVCGAPNLRIGLHCPFKIPKRKMEFGGILSEILLLSELEVGISEDHCGVLEINEPCKSGDDLISVLPYVEDYIIEIDNKSLTHRPDLWSHRGIAREICAITGRELKKMDFSILEGKDNCLSVSVEDEKLCPRYMAMVYDCVQVEDSPFWLKQILRNVGIRPINNVVDITNFIMCDVGNPTHAFDKRFIKGDKIIIRRALKDERIRTLDGIERQLTDEDLIITDAIRPIAIAGVMGGEESEINKDTKEIVLESANFNPTCVRRSAIRHSLRTEASSRFEKSLDPDFAKQAVSLFTKLLLEICPSARIKSPLYDVANFLGKLPEINITSEFINKKLGIFIEDEKIKNILESLEFKVEENKKGDFRVTPPSFRATKDISIPEDIVEEVGRLYGYHKIKPKPPSVALEYVQPLKIKEIEREVKKFLSYGCGFTEVMTYSFDYETFLKKINFFPLSRCEILNPISSDMKFLKSSLIPNLLMSAEKNSSFFEEFKIYEVGRVFFNEKTTEGIPLQIRKCGGLSYQKNLNPDREGVLLFKLKGVVEEIFKNLKITSIKIFPKKCEEDYPWLHKKRRFGIFYNDKSIGYISQINPLILKHLDLYGDISIFEISLDGILQIEESVKKFSPLPRFPSISFDLSVIVDEKVSAEEIENIIKTNSPETLNQLKLLSVYKGEPIERGKKSITYRMIFLHKERTLENEEVMEVVKRIIEKLKELGGYLRDA